MAAPWPAALADRWFALRRERTRRPGPARGVLIVSAGGLGDMVLFSLVLPRLAAVARADEPVSVLVRADARPMTFLFPPGITVVAVDFARLRRNPLYRLSAYRRLFRANYRQVVSADYLRHPDLDEALIAACRAGETVAMGPRPWPKYDEKLRRNRALYDRLFESGPPGRDKVVRWNDFANWLTASSRPPPRVRIDPATLPPPARPETPTVVIQPFSAVREKQSPVDLYRRIIRALPGDHRVLVTGAAGDMARNPEFRALLDAPRVTFDGSSFQALVPVLRGARLVISVDTALMHLAVAVGAPVLCLASAAYVGEIVPYDPAIAPDNATFAWHDMPCAGCLGACVLAPEDGMYPCVARLDGDAVVAAVLDRLGRPGPHTDKPMN